MKRTGSGAATAEPAASPRSVEIAREGDRPDATTETPRLVLLAFEAKTRGFRNTLAFRRWCRRRGVAVVNDGRLQWVDRIEVDAAIARIVAGERASESNEGVTSTSATSPAVDPVALAVETLILTRRNR